MAGFAALAGPLLFAHRGASTRFAENSLEAFAAALAAGADAIETDAHMTRDGHVVLCHDPSGARVAGVAYEIRASSLQELKRWALRGDPAQASAQPVRMPTLDEALSAFPNALFNVDVKQSEPDMLPQLLALLGRHAAEARVLLTSFSSSTTRRIRALGYPGPTGLGQSEAAIVALAPRVLLGRRPPRGRRLQIPPRHGVLVLDRARLVDKAHALGLCVDYWVINDLAHAERLLARGADGIVTDDPHALAELFARAPATAGWRARHPAPGAARG